MNWFRILTLDTQICLIIVIVLLIVMASGMLGYRVGWSRCVEYIEDLNFNDIETKRG